MSRRPLSLYLAAAVVPLIILLSLPLRPAVVSALGDDVLLPVTLQDTRDLLLGDNVALTFAAASVPVDLFDGEPSPGEIWQVELKKGDDGLWTPSAARKSGAKSPYLTGTVLRGQWREAGSPVKLNLGVGMKRFYVKEGSGASLEEAAKSGTLCARVSIWRGVCVITGLEPAP